MVSSVDLNVDVSNWILILLGPDMPFHLHGHRMVTSKDQTKAYIVGGYDGYEKMSQIYEMVCTTPDECQFNKLKTEMSAPKASHVAVPIEKGFAQRICA